MSSAKDTRLGTETFPEACPTTPLPKSRDIVTSSRTLTLVAVSASHSTNYRELAKGRHCRLIGACTGHSHGDRWVTSKTRQEQDMFLTPLDSFSAPLQELSYIITERK